jgi:hypothetical protein
MTIFIQNNWLLIVILNSVISLVVTPIIVAIINKKTITLSSADDVIKLKEYRATKRNEKRKSKFCSKLYRICFQKQKRYKGWTLWDFYEFGDIENRWFRVKNNEGEYLTIHFPEGLIVRRYGFDLNDRLEQGHYSYIPNLIEELMFKLKQKHITRIMDKYFPSLISYLEDKKKKNETIEINEIYRQFNKIKYYIIENMLLDLFHKKQRIDLTNIIVTRQLGTNITMPYFTNSFEKV